VRDLETKLERLLRARDRGRLTPAERTSNDESIRRAVLALWQTRMLRLEKLGVLDEVANGVSFFVSTFLPEVPRLYAGLQDELVDAITRGEKVAVSGLITVERTQRSARTGRNPQTGESIDIPAANTVKVTAGSNLKKAASSVPV